MQRLVCWTLMGVRTSGERDVWYQLGTFESKNSAVEAAASSYWTNQGYHDVSVVPYYRVDQNSTLTSSSGAGPSTARAARTASGRTVHTAV